MSNQVPTYRAKDLHKHRSIQDGIWVSYKDGVYDITEFLKEHPGGEKSLMMVAGGPLEFAFGFYGFHKFFVEKDLLKYKVGLLSEED